MNEIHTCTQTLSRHTACEAFFIFEIPLSVFPVCNFDRTRLVCSFSDGEKGTDLPESLH